jgi:hypothetical protein
MERISLGCWGTETGSFLVKDEIFLVDGLHTLTVGILSKTLLHLTSNK